MLKRIKIADGVKLQDYDMYSSLANSMRELRTEAEALIPKCKSHKVWMINSTEHGGGVAEMMPRLISILHQLGVECEWIVATTDRKEFFDFTKKVHNLIHGEGNFHITQEDIDVYEKVNKENAEELLTLIKPADIVVIHDPQPLAIGKYLKGHIDNDFRLIWRCHIGLDTHTESTKGIWNFLKPYIEIFEHSIFSSSEYIPGFLTGKTLIMAPTIDPLDHKNRDLALHKTIGIFCNSGLLSGNQPVLTPGFKHRVKRLQPDGSFTTINHPEDPGLLFRPFILQISRWDRLKGFLPAIKGFEKLKKGLPNHYNMDNRHTRRLQLVELVLAGPDPDQVDDDPEGTEVLNEISAYYAKLPKDLQATVSILKIPMSSRKENEIIVNALQRASTVVLQNSIKEGFGLTVTEAMWKKKPVVGSSAFGIKSQVRDKVDGLIISDPEDPNDVALTLDAALSDSKAREVWGYNGQSRVIDKYLIFAQVRKWIELFSRNI